MNKQCFWGEPDDVEPLPAWMAPHAQNKGSVGPGSVKSNGKSLMESIEDAMKKPAIQIDHNTFNLDDVHIQLK